MWFDAFDPLLECPVDTASANVNDSQVRREKR